MELLKNHCRYIGSVPLAVTLKMASEPDKTVCVLGWRVIVGGTMTVK
jgi:hypothetical protein